MKDNPFLGNYFEDGRRQIDYILVWEDYSDDRRGGHPTRIHRERRKKFQDNLLAIGVQLELHAIHGDPCTTNYLKVHIPWDLMCDYAEKLRLCAPIQEVDGDVHHTWSQKLLKRCRIGNFMFQKIPNEPPDYYTCQFRKSKLSSFIGSDQHDTYFTPIQRHQVAFEILASQPYGRRERGEVGISNLLDSRTYSTAYILHDGDYHVDWRRGDLKDPSKLNPRQVLYWYWARWTCWYRYQPINHIRAYFGEKIAYYFAWLGLYTSWLLPASIVGILVFLYGLFTVNDHVPSREVCSTDFKMCPMCDDPQMCKYWNLRHSCVYTKLTYLFDHPGTVFYAAFMSIWAVTFLECWKRKCAKLAHRWNVLDYEIEEEHPRPQYSVRCSSTAINPITGANEPHFSRTRRKFRVAASLCLVVMMLVVVIIFSIAVIVYRLLVNAVMMQNKYNRSKATFVAGLTAAGLNLLFILLISKVYERLALKMTEWEMYRSQSEFDDHLTFKVFSLQFVNFYGSIFYIAFFKGRFIGYPGHYTYTFGMRNEQCDQGSCLMELAQQLIVIMIGKQLINNCQEILVPLVIKWYNRFKSRKRMGEQSLPDLSSRHCIANGTGSFYSSYLSDFTLLPYQGLFDEYLEMVIQFGFITIFVAAFPLAPLCALMNNWIEIRLDANKLVCNTRRPMAVRVQNIGVWYQIMAFIVRLGVITNAFIIAFTSNFLPKLIYKYEVDQTMVGFTNFTLAWAPPNTTHEPCRYMAYRDDTGELTSFFWQIMAVRLAFVVLFEHVIFGLAHLLDLLIPDIPSSLQESIRRQRYLAKNALLDVNLT